MSFVRIPAVALVPSDEVEALRLKFAKSRSDADYEAFWNAVQKSKQPVIEDHEPTWAKHRPFDDEFLFSVPPQPKDVPF